MAESKPEVEVDAVCDKVAFKAGKKNFLFLGSDGESYDVKLKLKDSLAEANDLSCRPSGDDFRRPKWLGGTGVPETQIAAEGGFEALDRRKFPVAGPKKNQFITGRQLSQALPLGWGLGRLPSP